MKTHNTNISIPKSLVSVAWLNEHLNAPNLIVLNASIKKVTSAQDRTTDIQIPGSRFFDIKHDFSDVSAPFPNTVPSLEQFSEKAKALGINSDSAIVVYDDKGIYSSARAWWLFKAFGHEEVAVLDGGLPKWLETGYKTDKKQENDCDLGNFKAKFNPNYFKYFMDMQIISNEHDTIILDARSANRFYGIDPEPRAGLRRGNIPNSKSLPYTIVQNHGIIKPPDELRTIFNQLNPKKKPMVFSCGSGITACILALAAELSGYTNTSVYDGSWTEWGSLVTE